MQMAQSVSDAVSFGFPGSKNPWSMSLNGLGDDSSFWDDLAKALPAVAQSAAQITTAINAPNQVNQITRGGVYPIGYSNGIPIYASTPAGVTPNNPYSLPSGYYPPAGVTPNYPPYSIYPNQYVNTAPAPSIGSLLSGPNAPLFVGGALVIVLLLAMK